jgi:hypothetical protein
MRGEGRCMAGAWFSPRTGAWWRRSARTPWPSGRQASWTVVGGCETGVVAFGRQVKASP